jgi:nucleoside triphosphate diphosphatase
MSSASASVQFARLLEMVQLLRSESAWTREQTFRTLRKHTIEEVFELVDAIDHDDAAAVREEIGDLFFHCVFYSVVAEPHWSAADALDSVVQKLIRRHPHVDFAAKSVRSLTADEEAQAWEAVKRSEKANTSADTTAHRSVLAGLARSTPALPKAVAVCHKLTSAGFSIADELAAVTPANAPVASALATLLDALRSDPSAAGNVIWQIANEMSQAGVDVDSALAATNSEVERQVFAVEKGAGARSVSQLSKEEQRALLLSK